jgi:hypothetical protein
MRIVLAVWFCVCAGRAAESDALAISANIQARHIPFVTLLDPLYASSTSNQIIGYTRCGDSALWTGALLAAESFRYNVTKSADALKNVKGALAGLKALADVTGDNRLARCIVPAASVYAANIANEEASNTVNQNPPWIWIDNTSRDQVVGAFLIGCGVDWDDPEVGRRERCGDAADRFHFAPPVVAERRHQQHLQFAGRIKRRCRWPGM